MIWICACVCAYLTFGKKKNTSHTNTLAQFQSWHAFFFNDKNPTFYCILSLGRKKLRGR